MSGRPQQAQQLFIPAPTGGLNLTDPPNQIAPNEALLLSRFYVLSNGIRSRGKLVKPGEIFAGDAFHVATLPSSTANYLFVGTDSNVYGKASVVGNSFSSVLPPAYVVTSGRWDTTIFAGRIFWMNGADPIFSNVSNTAGTVSAFTGAFGTTDELIQAWNFKERLYFIRKNSAEVWYGGVGSVAGALTQFNLTNLLKFGGKLLFGTTFTYSQGLEQDLLWVVVSTEGEILTYSGDNPGATNWRLISRLRGAIPFSQRSFLNMGADVYMLTYAGLVSLSQLFAQPNLSPGAIAISHNIDRAFQGEVPPDTYPYSLAKHEVYPLIFILLGGGSDCWAVNYTTGAWCKIADAAADFGESMISMAWFDNKMHILAGDNQLTYIDDNTQETDTTFTGIWRTGYLSPGNYMQTRATRLRYLISPRVGTALNANTSIFADFNDQVTPTGDTIVRSGLTAEVTYVFETRPPATGEYLAVQIQPRLSDSIAEYYGFSMMYEEGGAY